MLIIRSAPLVARIAAPLSLAAIVSFGAPLPAQPAAPVARSLWEGWKVREIDPSGSLLDIFVAPGGQRGWAVGGRGGGGILDAVAMRTVDGGRSWNAMAIPTTVERLAGIHFVDAQLGWTVGDDGVVLATGDGGATWLPQQSGTSRDLAAVHFVDRNFGWACGGWRGRQPYLVLRTTDGGATWQDASFGSGFSCEDVFFVDANTGWVSGRDSSLDAAIHRTDDGGRTWTRQTVPLPSGNTGVTAIRFADANTGWAATSSLYQSPRGALLHTIDGGATWTVQTYTGKDYNDALAVQDTQRVAVASFQLLGTASAEVLVTGDGGRSWQRHTPPVLTYMRGLAFDGADLWIAADYSQIVRSRDAGATWTWESYAPLWRSIAWRDARNGWLVTGSRSGTDGYCRRTTDGGRTWLHDPTQPGGAQVDFHDPLHGWILQEGRSAVLWRTTDAGTTWSARSIGANGRWIEGFFFVDARNGWAFGGNGTIRATTDGGVTWRGQSSGTTLFVQGVHFVDLQNGWAVGGLGSGNGFVLHTTDGGNTWVPQTPASTSHLLDVDFVDPQRGFAVAVGGGVQRTLDGGSTWRIVGSIPHIYLDRVVMQDASTGWAIARNHLGSGSAEDGRGFIYRTEDGGRTWRLDYRAPWSQSAITDIDFRMGPPAACGGHGTVLVGGS